MVTSISSTKGIGKGDAVAAGVGAAAVVVGYLAYRFGVKPLVAWFRKPKAEKPAEVPPQQQQAVS